VFSQSFHKSSNVSLGDLAGGDSWERSPDKCKVLDKATNPLQARNKCWPSCDANVTALETIMALAAVVERMPLRDPLLTVEDVAARLNVTKDWVWDHSSRKAPYLPVIRMSDGVLRYRLSEVEEFISERERLSALRSGRR
jgi:predicted DNA-binding transcriptional regulator AlpA